MTYISYPGPENLRRSFIDGVDPDEAVDLLGISTEELLDAFPDKLENYWRGEYEFEEEDKHGEHVAIPDEE